MNSIYNKYVDDVVKSEYTEVMPVSDLNFNSPNNFTTFKLDHGDSFYNGGIRFHITGKLVKKTDGSEYAAKSTIKLVDNFPAFLFSRIEVRKHNTLIDSVEHVGITSTVKGLVSYSDTHKNALTGCGFVSKFEGGGKFEAYGKLGHLGLGFFDDLKFPMFKGGFDITFIRAEDNDAIFHWKGTGTEPEDGKIIIESFVLRVPLVEYKPESSIKLISELANLSDKLVYNYLKWECIEKKGVIGSSFSFDITNLYRNISNPQFIMIALQRNRLSLQTADPSKFDSLKIKNAAVKIDREVYPQESLNLDIDNNKFRVLFDMYMDFRRARFRDENVYFDANTFIKDYAIIVVNTSLHPANIDNSKSKIQIELDFAEGLTAETIAYVVAVSHTAFSYDVRRNLIRFY